MSDDANFCIVCNNEANFVCSCRTVFYCSKKCQKSHWKTHKPLCVIPDVEGTCTRCEEEIKRGTRCTIPHPGKIFSIAWCTAKFHLNVVSYRVFVEGIDDHDSSEYSYTCTACNKHWKETTRQTWHPATSDRPSWTEIHETIITGSKWCYQGHHTKDPIPACDNRVKRSSDTDLVLNPNLQQQLNSLPSTVRRLTICANHSFPDDPYSLEAYLPDLEVLVIDGIQFKKLVLTSELTPKLQKLTLINLGDINACDFRVTAPLLKDIEIQYMNTSSSAPINAMLAACTRLEKFYSYKLQVFQPVHFASTELKYLNIRRSDCLSKLSVYAPKLEKLDLIACYDLESVKILNSHHTSSQLQPGTVPTIFTVNLENSICSDRLMTYFQQHPRVRLLPLSNNNNF